MDLSSPPPPVHIAPTVADHERGSISFISINEAFPGVRRVSRDPPIYEVPNFLSDAEIAAIMTTGVPGLARSIVVDAAAGKSAAPSRTSESTYLDKAAFAWLGAKVSALTGKPFETQEPPQLARYEEGQFYLPHFDAFDATAESGRECIATGGQRVATVLIYLNTVPPGCGGETHFPRIGRKFRPEKGTAVLFFPCTTDAKLDPLALHGAESIKVGSAQKKYVCQVWVRQGAFEKGA